jgi:hypothetical protein
MPEPNAQDIGLPEIRSLGLMTSTEDVQTLTPSYRARLWVTSAGLADRWAGVIAPDDSPFRIRPAILVGILLIAARMAAIAWLGLALVPALPLF